MPIPGFGDEDGLSLQTVSYLWEKRHKPGDDWTEISTDAGWYFPVEADVGAVLRVTVTYTDGHGPGKTLTTTPSQPVADINDLVPVFVSAPRGRLTDNRLYKAGEVIFDGRAIPDVDGADMAYSLSGPDAGLFGVSASGQVSFRVDTRPDWEDPAWMAERSYSFVLRAVSSYQGRDQERSMNVRLVLDNVNDTPPVFTSAERFVGPREGTLVTADDVLYTAAVTPDIGTVSYSLPDVFYTTLSGGRIYNLAQLFLKIDPATGAVTLNGGLTDAAFDAKLDSIYGERQ